MSGAPSESQSYTQLPADQLDYFGGKDSVSGSGERSNTLGIAVAGDHQSLTCPHDDKRQKRFQQPSDAKSDVSSLYNSYFNRSKGRRLESSQQASRAESVGSRSSRQLPRDASSEVPQSYSRDNYYNNNTSYPPSEPSASMARSQRSEASHSPAGKSEKGAASVTASRPESAPNASQRSTERRPEPASTEPSVRLYEVDDIALNEKSQRSESSEISGWNPRSRPLSAQPHSRSDSAQAKPSENLNNPNSYDEPNSASRKSGTSNTTSTRSPPHGNNRSNASSFRPEDPRSQYPESRSQVNARPESQSGRPESRSARPESQSGRPESYSVRPESQSGRPESRSARPESQSGRPESRSARPESQSGRPESYSVRPESQSGRPESRSARPESQSGRPESYSVRPESQSGRPESRSARPESQSGRPESRSARPESQSGRPESRSARPESQSGRPESRSARPESQSGRPQQDAYEKSFDSEGATPVRMSSEAGVREVDPEEASMPSSHHPARKAVWEESSQGTESNCYFHPRVNRAPEKAVEEGEEEQPAPAPVFSRLYADAQRYNRQRTEREKALELQRQMERGEIPYDREALVAAGIDVESESDFPVHEPNDAQRGTAAPGEEPRRRSVNFEVFDRLARPTQVTLKREQQKELEERQKKEEEERRAESRSKEFSEVAAYNWQLPAKSYTLSDIQRQNALYVQ